jgi:hypothetical protein
MDIDITLRIDDTKINDLKVGLAKYFKVDSTDITPAWFKAFLNDMIFKFYKTGKIWIAQETTAPVIDENIVEVI